MEDYLAAGVEGADQSLFAMWGTAPDVRGTRAEGIVSTEALQQDSVLVAEGSTQIGAVAEPGVVPVEVEPVVGKSDAGRKSEVVYGLGPKVIGDVMARLPHVQCTIDVHPGNLPSLPEGLVACNTLPQTQAQDLGGVTSFIHPQSAVSKATL